MRIFNFCSLWFDSTGNGALAYPGSLSIQSLRLDGIGLRIPPLAGADILEQLDHKKRGFILHPDQQSEKKNTLMILL